MSTLAVDTIVLGPGDIRTAHSPRECVPLAELDLCVEYLNGADSESIGACDMTDKRDAPLWENSLLEFRNRVAAATPTPGGGAVAAVAASFAAALLQMMCAISSTRKPDARMTAIANQVKSWEEELAHYAEEDIRVFDRYRLREIQGRFRAWDTQQYCWRVRKVRGCGGSGCEAGSVRSGVSGCHAGFSVEDMATAHYLLKASRKALLECHRQLDRSG